MSSCRSMEERYDLSHRFCEGFSHLWQKSAKVSATEIVGDIFPGLDLQDLSGATIRTSCLHTKKYRWSGLGSEMGTVIITALLKEKNDIVCRAKLKFEGVISVLQVLKAYDEEDKVLYLISSMVGPPTIWTVATREEDTEIRRTAELLGCVGHDAIVCSAFSKNILAIGTYTGRLIFFRRGDVLGEEKKYPCLSGDQTGDEKKVYPCLSVDHTAPILALRFLSDNELVILSRNGVHMVSLNIKNCGDGKPQHVTGQIIRKEEEEKLVLDLPMPKRRSLRKLDNKASFR